MQAGDIILLEGPFGAGKTVFVQGLAEGMGIRDGVSSPSFVLVNEYHNRLTLYHADLYRVQGVEEAEALGLEEYLSGRGVFVAEWPEQVAEVWPGEHLWMKFSIAGRRERVISARARGSRYVRILEAFAESRAGRGRVKT